MNTQQFYGGSRLQPQHFEVPWLPTQMAENLSSEPAMPVGSPGKVGILELDFVKSYAQEKPKTVMDGHYQKAPLKIVRPHYYDPARPDMPFVFTLDMGGGVVQGDRLRTDITLKEDAAVHVTSQSHTKIYQMDSGYATAQTNLTLEPGAYLEYLPDPVVPFKDSRYYQTTKLSIAPTATAVFSETFYAGRIGQGEVHQYQVFASDLLMCRPDGVPFVADRMRLLPNGSAPNTPSSTASAVVFSGRTVVQTMYVVTEKVDAKEMSTLLEETADQVVKHYQDETALFAASTLSEANSDVESHAGAWIRFLTCDTVVSLALSRALYQAVHLRLCGTEAPPSPKF